MLCNEVHAAIQEGVSTENLPHSSHIDSCAACQERVMTARLLHSEPADSLPTFDFSSLKEATQHQLHQERSRLGHLRSLTTGRHRIIIGSVAVVLILQVALFLTRPDLSVYPLGRMATLVALLSGIGLASLFLSTRPLHAPPPSSLATWGVGSAAVLSALIVGLLPQAHTDHPASLAGAGPDLWPLAAGCFFMGVLIAAPIVLIAWIIDRQSTFRTSRGVLIALCASLAGLIALQSHCPITHPTHLLAGHTTVSLAAMLLGGVLLFLTRRRRPRS